MKKICLSISATHQWETIKKIASRAEELGYHSIWFGDHLAAGWRAKFHASRLECWTLMSALAPLLERTRIGPLVLANSFRNPALMAKMASTLDVISNGRLEMGAGAGWSQREYEAYGYKFPSAATRIKQMEEGIRIMKLMWTQEQPSFKGKYYSIKEAVCKPKPIQKPHPPLTVGGAGERLTLRVVAKEADRCNFFAPPEKYDYLLGVLKKHCKDIGRDYNEIEKSLLAGVYIFDDEEQGKEKLKKIYRAREPSAPFEDWLESYKKNVIFGNIEECLRRLKAYDPLGVDCYILKFEDSTGYLPSQDGFELFNDHVLEEIR